MNALRHGLTAQNPVLPTDNRNDYEAHVSHWFETLAPEGFLETELVQTIADTYWRVNRIPALEAKLVAKDIDVLKMVKALDSLSRHEMRLRKLISKTLDQLVTIKTDHHRQQKQSQLNNQKPQNGFVFAKLQTPSPQAGPQGFADPETESFDTQENGCEAVEEVAQAA